MTFLWAIIMGEGMAMTKQDGDAPRSVMLAKKQNTSMFLMSHVTVVWLTPQLSVRELWLFYLKFVKTWKKIVAFFIASSVCVFSAGWWISQLHFAMRNENYLHPLKDFSNMFKEEIGCNFLSCALIMFWYCKFTSLPCDKKESFIFYFYKEFL